MLLGFSMGESCFRVGKVFSGMLQLCVYIVVDLFLAHRMSSLVEEDDYLCVHSDPDLRHWEADMEALLRILSGFLLQCSSRSSGNQSSLPLLLLQILLTPQVQQSSLC